MSTTVPAHHNAPSPTGHHREADVASMFNRIAATYDRLNNCISLGMHHQWKKQAITALQPKKGDHFLDVATGTGDLAQRMAALVGPTGHITGVDISEEMLAVAQQRLANTSSKQPDIAPVTFTQCSAMALPFDNNTMDGVIISFGLRNVDDTQQVLTEMARVVKPGGWVVSLDTAPDPWLPGFWWYFSKVMPTVGKWISGDEAAYTYLCNSTKAFATPAELKRQFEAAGLTHTSIKRLAFGSAAILAGQKA